jgi:hypothetical protein
MFRRPTREGIALALLARAARLGFAMSVALPIATGLFSSTALPLLAGPITPVRLLLVPAAGGCPTGLAAIAAQGVPRLEAPLATF